MGVLVLIILIVLCLFSLFMIAVVLLPGKSAGLTGDISGAAEQFMGKTKAKSYEGTLKKLTKVAAIGIMVLAVALVILQVYVLPNVGKDTTDVQETPAVEETAPPEDLTLPDATP